MTRRLLMGIRRKAIVTACAVMVSANIAAPAAETTVETVPAGQTDHQSNPATADNTAERNLSALIPKSIDLSIKLLDMQAEFDVLDTKELFEEELLKLAEARNRLKEQLHSLTVDPQQNLQQLTELQVSLKEAERKAENLATRMQAIVAKLDTWARFWNNQEQEAASLQRGLPAAHEIPVIDGAMARIRQLISEARQRIEAALVPLLVLQSKAGDIELALHQLNLQIDALFQNKFHYNQHAPSLFSKQYAEQFNKGLWHRARAGFLRIVQPDYDFLLQNKLAISLTILLFVFLAVRPRLGKNRIAEKPHLQFLINRSIEVSLLTSISLFALFRADIPPFWLAFIRSVSLLCIMRLAAWLFSDRYQRWTIDVLIGLLFVSDLLSLIALPQALTRLFIVFSSAAILAIALVSQRTVPAVKDFPPWLLWFRRGVAVTCTIVILTELSGQADLAYYIFSASLRSLFAVLFVWVLFQIFSGLLEVLVISSPIRSMQDLADKMVRFFRPVLVTGCVIVLAALILVAWNVFPTFPEALWNLGGVGVTVGATRLSLSLVLGAALVLYVSYLFSQALQALMMRSVLAHRSVERGIQLSITRLVHYAIMLIGFLGALGALGFNLTNLTILGGALGVGIGFGLQAIVNNFASGLILLFERPIKVGDTIEIGGELGEVSEVGLRSTIVQTFDNAEIVVPNSDLITNQVTNWTLQARRVRVRVPIGVAYGSDIEKVLKIMLDCAHEHPQVLSSPKPMALFQAFGASSLDFELRVFIPEFNDKPTVLSDLNKALYDELGAAGIEIPFPQTDVHLRSIAPEMRGIRGDTV